MIEHQVCCVIKQQKKIKKNFRPRYAIKSNSFLQSEKGNEQTTSGSSHGGSSSRAGAGLSRCSGGRLVSGSRSEGLGSRLDEGGGVVVRRGGVVVSRGRDGSAGQSDGLGAVGSSDGDGTGTSLGASLGAGALGLLDVETRGVLVDLAVALELELEAVDGLVTEVRGHLPLVGLGTVVDLDYIAIHVSKSRAFMN